MMNNQITNYEDLQNKIAELESSLIKLKRQADTLDSQKEGVLSAWPNWFEKYYYITTNIVQGLFQFGPSDTKRQDGGNVFRTKEEAKEMLEFFKVYLELNQFSSPFTSNKPAYQFYYNHVTGELLIGHDITFQCPNLYFESRAMAQAAIKQVGEERILRHLFGIRKADKNRQ